MSPARSLLVACACAALLHAASSAEVRDSRRNLRTNQCTAKLIGRATNDEEHIEPDPIPLDVPKAVIVIPDKCAVKGKLLVGELVVACDDEAPEVALGPWPHITPAIVIRKGRVLSIASVYVTQYCLDKLSAAVK